MYESGSFKSHGLSTSKGSGFPSKSSMTNNHTHFALFSLSNRNYRNLWLATLCNTSGQWIQQITLSWLVWELSKSAMIVGITTGLRTIPYLFIGPVSGVIADRIDRRRILITAQTAMATIAILFALVVAMDWIRVWHAMLFSFIMGCGFSMCQPVMQALVANTVPRKDLGNAIALSAMAQNVSRVVGPALGGILIVSLGAAGNFLLQAVLFIGVVAAVFAIKTPFRDAAPGVHASIFKSLQEGVKYIWNEKALLSLITLSFIPSFFVVPITHIIPAFTGMVLKADATTYGYLMAAYGIGGLLATLFMAASSVNVRGGWLGILSLGCGTLLIFLLSLSKVPWTACLLFTAAGFSMIMFRINNNTLVQILTPDSLRGRITAIYQMDHALTPLASFILGAMADLFSVPTAMKLASMGGLFTLILLFTCVRAVRNLRSLHI